MQQQYRDVFDKFEDLMRESNQKTSIRIKLLIKNMFDHRKEGWPKAHSKNEGPMKTEDLRLQQMKMIEE